jgi:hypothetical protein
MFSVYVLISGKTGRRYVGSCADLAERLRQRNAGDSLATSMENRGGLFTKNNFLLAPPPVRESVISKLVADAMNLTDHSPKESLPRQRVPPRRASSGSNPVTPIKLSVDVFSLRSNKWQERPAICRLNPVILISTE